MSKHNPLVLRLLDQGSVVVLCRQGSSCIWLYNPTQAVWVATCTIAVYIRQLQHWSQIQWRGLYVLLCHIGSGISPNHFRRYINVR